MKTTMNIKNQKFSTNDQNTERNLKNIPMYMETLKQFASTKGNAAYYINGYVGAVKIENSYFLIDKHSVTTRFFFSDEGAEYSKYESLTQDKNMLKDYFIDQNLNKLTDLIAHVRAANILCFEQNYKDVICIRSYNSYNTSDCITATPEEKTLILEALECCKDEFEKRLLSYLKRYGVAKLRLTTYWANR